MVQRSNDLELTKLMQKNLGAEIERVWRVIQRVRTQENYLLTIRSFSSHTFLPMLPLAICAQLKNYANFILRFSQTLYI